MTWLYRSLPLSPFLYLYLSLYFSLSPFFYLSISLSLLNLSFSLSIPLCYCRNWIFLLLSWYSLLHYMLNSNSLWLPVYFLPFALYSPQSLFNWSIHRRFDVGHSLSNAVSKKGKCFKILQNRWCRENDEKCRTIAQNAKELYKLYVSREGILDYMQVREGRTGHGMAWHGSGCMEEVCLHVGWLWW